MYDSLMSTVPEIERAVEKLSPEELRAFRAWFAERDASEWDRQFEADVVAGRLDALGEKAIGELRAGRCVDL
jgi:hypothetical protein